MSKTVYYTATSIDGFITDEHNSLDWLFEAANDSEQTEEDEFARFFEHIGAMAMGSTTYEWVLEHENLLEQPQKWKEFYGDTPSWVFTHRELPVIPGADVRFVQEKVAPVHRVMVEAAAGKDVWIVGGGDLVGQFADEGLLDEIQLSVAPVTLGGGAPLLPRRLLASDLTLVAVKQRGPFVDATYRVDRGGDS